MDKLLQEMQFLYILSDELYKRPELEKVTLAEIDLNSAIELSTRNNMLYYHCKRILELYADSLDAESKNRLKEYVVKGEEELKKIYKTVLFLNERLPDHLSIKTFRGYPRIPNDLDVLVRDFENALLKLSLEGFQITNISRQREDAILEKEGFYIVHLHQKVHWLDSDFMDLDFIFKNPRKVKLGGVDLRIPGFDADFLIHAAHINFEPLHITLSDLLYLFSLSGNINWQLLSEQAEKYRWKKTFLNTLKIMDSLYHRLYRGACPFGDFNFKHRPLPIGKSFILPLTLPRKHLLNTLFEKRLFKQAFLKFSKSANVFIKADSHSGYYEPAEKRSILDRI